MWQIATMDSSNFSKKVIIIFFFSLLAIGERVFFDLGPNIELVTTVMILSAFYLGGKHAMMFTLGVLILSDLIIGNSNIYIFTWTGFLIPAFFVSKLFNNQQSTINNSLRGTTTGIGANLFFFLWTNFGVWALDSFGIYANNLSGLVTSYINALPFLKYQLTSTIIFVPLGFFAVEIILEILRNLSFGKSTIGSISETLRVPLRSTRSFFIPYSFQLT